MTAERSKSKRGGDPASPTSGQESKPRKSAIGNGGGAKRAATVRRSPVDSVERRPVAELLPYASNPMTHPESQVNDLAASMREHGQTQLILVDPDGEIIAGHGRVLAAQQLGWKDLLVAVARGWSEAEKRAYRIKDNQLARAARWDGTLLRQEFGALTELGYQLTSLGFEAGELAALSVELQTDGAEAREEHWQGMPGFDQSKQYGFRSLMVHFVDQAAVDLFCKKLGIKLSDKAKFHWYPKVVIERSYDKRWRAGDSSPGEASRPLARLRSPKRRKATQGAGDNGQP